MRDASTSKTAEDSVLILRIVSSIRGQARAIEDDMMHLSEQLMAIDSRMADLETALSDEISSLLNEEISGKE